MLHVAHVTVHSAVENRKDRPNERLPWQDYKLVKPIRILTRTLGTGRIHAQCLPRWCHGVPAPCEILHHGRGLHSGFFPEGGGGWCAYEEILVL